MKIAICDDEPIYIETTSRLLQKWAGEHGIEMQIFTYDNGCLLYTSPSPRDCS